ncbi:MAG: hypothetical protein IGS49_29345 [Chlorogloeopsis fritschii C42_A2020_084]|uniref:hypothetical protein n=1 Tax=Chlorogloeopsis fritschii TaxID=1124 RepID=UPI0019DEB3E9|nr:hypothetical protein [Chlorogloeopsis fritschii]MBF2009421.1 hypothetical protein [Chlorogloeopsis fritschii C42_A2020_084]
MFGFIKNLITGIMKFITGLLPGKKKNNGYYLELKEEAETAVEKVSDAAKAAAEKVSDAAKAAAEKVATTTKADAEKAVASKGATTTKADAGKAVASKGAATANGKKPAQSVAAAPEAKNGVKSPAKPAQVELVQTAEGVTVEPKSEKASAAAAKVVKSQPKETTFAPKYLVPNSTNGRRRPGANMNSFLEMARQVKTPNTNK